MKIVVPGGYYSYDSSLKKIYLDYKYYNLGLENIESIRNLTRGTILYNYKNSNTQVTCENGIITHQCPCVDASTDKIQIVLKTPIPSLDTLSFLPLLDSNGAYLLDSDGKILEVPV